MLIELLNQNTIEQFLIDEQKIKIDKQSSDFISYKEFVKYFKDLEKITKHNLVIGINFTYGWMPTIFNFKSTKLNEVLKILNSAKKDNTLKENELELLKECFNNSLVGTSKLLHFINPNKFAIWDSRIYRYLKNEFPHKYRVENTKSYLDYLSFCNTIINKTEYDSIHKSMENKIGYKMTKYRTIDLIMYLNGGDKNSRRL
ncbi:hypothetical protein [Flammeovirga sp. SJP92]|uniref:hypothetical protein n=1 Tax=Flammeovirga sp. SJP92 TaxID=1775430 RepID=UPI000789663E|nr:hypothetical protein [Flammeovirga sp. SJP92]KXX66792.1 hypothetical protein AVL50_30125 [Flammeovirga sp. SJP92]